MLCLSLPLGRAQGADTVGERDLRVVPVDQQQVNPGQPELLQALRHRAFEIAGRKLVPIDLGGDEYVLALEAGRSQSLMQPVANPLLVAVALGGVEMPVTKTHRGLDGVYARLLLECHGAKPDRRNAGSIHFDDIHCRVLLAQAIWQRPKFQSRPSPRPWPSALACGVCM